jgi:hypothetical protein
MTTAHRTRLTTAAAFAACAALTLAGCADTKQPMPTVVRPQAKAEKGHDHAHDADAASAKENLAKLSPEDRALAEQQKNCVITDEPLGEMGVPVKIMVKDQPVFLCCKSCEKKALEDPDKTLAKVAELKAKPKAAEPAK